MLNLHLCSKPALETISKLDEIVLTVGDDVLPAEHRHYWAVKYAAALRYFVDGGLRQAMWLAEGVFGTTLHEDEHERICRALSVDGVVHY